MSDRDYTGKWARFWCVTQRTVQRWRADFERGEMTAAPDDLDGMLRWSLSPGRKPPEFLRRCTELRLKRERGRAAGAAFSAGHAASPPPGGPGAAGAPLAPPPTNPHAPPPPPPIDADWAAFQAQQAASAPKDQARQIAELEEHLAFADYALRRARERGDEHGQKKFADELIKFSKAVKEQKAYAAERGLESGELVPRSAVKLILASHAYWTMRAVDLALDSLSGRLMNLSFPEEARAILEPELLSVRLVAPYARAATLASRNALPPWLVDDIRDTVDDFIEHGAAHFDALYLQPLPPPAAPPPPAPEPPPPPAP